MAREEAATSAMSTRYCNTFTQRSHNAHTLQITRVHVMTSTTIASGKTAQSVVRYGIWHLISVFYRSVETLAPLHANGTGTFPCPLLYKDMKYVHALKSDQGRVWSTSGVEY